MLSADMAHAKVGDFGIAKVMEGSMTAIALVAFAQSGAAAFKSPVLQAITRTRPGTPAMSLYDEYVAQRVAQTAEAESRRIIWSWGVGNGTKREGFIGGWGRRGVDAWEGC